MLVASCSLLEAFLLAAGMNKEKLYSEKSYVIFMKQSLNIAALMLADIVITFVKGKGKLYFKKLLDKVIYSNKEINASIKDKISLKCVFNQSFFNILLNA